ncbi:MAG: cobyrinate a,c-diamide synthase [Oscillospiraceae bacterium]
MSRLLLTAMESGSGKTVVTCGLLAALKQRGLDVRAFKCGPDYIDPLFHSRVLGIPSRNLDLWLQGADSLQSTLAGNQGEIAVLEGAMGFYDGVGGTDSASAWATASATETPAVLVVRPRGASLTLAAQIKGLAAFRENSHLAGILLNACSPALHAHLAPILEGETGLPVLGYLPTLPEAVLESRHLGLLTADEVTDFSARFRRIAAQLEQSADISALLRLADTAPPLEVPPVAPPSPVRCRIAVARDGAFCFFYQENLERLQAAGAELCFFSPLQDRALPPHSDGLYLPGGYPELYGAALGENTALRTQIREAVTAGLPTVAECGGFLYLQQTLQDTEGVPHPMVGALSGDGIKTPRLQRFGYAALTAKGDSLLFRAGEEVPVHEFHHWDCTENGDDFTAQKGTRSWHCGFATDTLYAAFPHLHFGGALPLAERFVSAAADHRQEEQA